MAVEARRGALGMSRDDLAGKAGVDRKTVYNLERDGRWPIARSRARLEVALGWPVGEMERIAAAPEREPEPVVPPEVRQMIERAPRDDQWKRDALEALEAIGRGRGASSRPEQRAG